MGLSRRACPALAGVQMRTVSKAIDTGRIKLKADGTMDAASADAMRHASISPANRMNLVARRSSAFSDQLHIDVTRR
jgi:hypothetical protein